MQTKNKSNFRTIPIGGIGVNHYLPHLEPIIAAICFVPQLRMWQGKCIIEFIYCSEIHSY